MATKSNAKRKPVPAPAPLKTPKTRINKEMKNQLLGHMVSEFDARMDDTELSETFIALVSQVNAILRAKYPEEDMPVLRKYKVVRVDTCLRFTILGKERVFVVRLQPPGQVRGAVADIPCISGCYNGDVYPCDKDFEILADHWTNQVERRRLLMDHSRVESRAFLHACRYLEDVEAVLPISEEMRKALGAQSRSLTVINPDIISRIKSDFAEGIAA